MDEGEPPRGDISTCSIFEPIWIFRAIRSYNEIHKVLLDYVVNILCRIFFPIFNLFLFKKNG